MVSDLGIYLLSFVRDFLQYLLGDLSSIPFTISLGSAVLLTIMYLASHISSTLIRLLIAPAWTFVVITYFFPALIPKEYEFASLTIFAAMIATTAVLLRRYRKTRGKDRIEEALSEVIVCMRSSQLSDPNQQIMEQDVKNEIREILRKHKIT